MGIGLVKEALLPAWKDLTPFARLVLVQMASTAYDDTVDGVEGRLFWGGHAFISVMLLGVGDDTPEWPAAQRRVRRAVRELMEAGAINYRKKASAGGRAVYEITTNRRRLPCGEVRPQTVDNTASTGPEPPE